MLPLLVNIGFQVLFHSPPGVLFTFPSRYYALSVTKSYLALEGGPSCFPPDFSCPAVLWVTARCLMVSSTGLLPSLAELSSPLPLPLDNALCRPATPKSMLFGLGSFPFARRYLGNRFFFLFLRVLRCFSSPGSRAGLCVHPAVTGLFPAGFPHSDIYGSQPACGSP